MRWIGALAVALAGVLLGVFTAAQNRSRIRSLESLCLFTELLGTELSYTRMPLPALFRELGERVEGTGGELCSWVVSELGAGAMFLPAWANAVRKLSEEERRALMPLGSALGRYGTEEVMPLISAAREELYRCLREARGKGADRCRAAVGLYGAGGFLLAILLI